MRKYLVKHLVFILFALISSVVVIYGDFKSHTFDPDKLPALLRFYQNFVLKSKDWRLTFRGPIKPPLPVVIVAIDNKSIKKIGRWPWSREITASLIRGMAEYGATVVALDIVFSETQNPAADRVLAESIASSGNVIEGYFFREEPHPVDPEVKAQIRSSRISQIRTDSGVTSVPLTEYVNPDANIALIGRGAIAHGYYNALFDADGLFRRLPLLLLYDGDVYPSLMLQALQQFTHETVRVHINTAGIRTIQLGNNSIPSNQKGELYLNYYGSSNNDGKITTYSAVDIIDKILPANELKGKMVFVGPTEEGIYDLRPTPFDAIRPGVEIHATAAANILEQRALIHNSRTDSIDNVLLFLLPFVLALLLGIMPNATMGIVSASGLSMLYLVVNYQLFTRYFLDLSLWSPLVAFAFTTVSSEIYRSLVVDRKGRYLKKAFSSYVSADLVARIIKNPESLTLGGEKREISILFSDIRGFTTLSEKLSPEELVLMLNEYLNPMTRIVLEEKGTLDKYIGDAVMALYNAPLDVAGHADHACRSALKMIAILDELNRTFVRRGLQAIDIGIGINTGDAVVGNMGASMRFDYTAIGDNVNLASRLEGLNKLYGTHIIVSESTKLQAGSDLPFREIDFVAVKGKQVPIPIYELMVGDAGEIRGRVFGDALRLYRNSEFAAAVQLFEDVYSQTHDHVSSLYIERCREFIESPPVEGWDGVYVAKMK